MVAVDCEMCYTQTALELSRVTLVGEDEQLLLDELVLPESPIVNYNTTYSGECALLTPLRLTHIRQ